MVEAHKELTNTSEYQENSLNDEPITTKTTLVGKIKLWRKGWGERWARLHANQVIYIIALVLYFTVDGDKEDPTTLIWLIGLLAFFGMARELWAIFVKVWESMLGRLLLLVSYAAIANFTLALASQKVNMVIGADPSQLYHTQGLATLLMLPLLIMIVSIIAVICMFGLLQILKLVTGLFILMRIIGKKAKPKEAFPKTFIIIRLILLFPVTMTMTSAVDWYGQQLNLADTSGFSFNLSENNTSGFTLNIGEGNKAAEQIAKVGIAGIEETLKDETLSDKEREDLLQLRQDLEGGIDSNFANFGPDNEEPTESTALESNVSQTVRNTETENAETENTEIDNTKTESTKTENTETETSTEKETPVDAPETPIPTAPLTDDYHFLDQLIASFVYHYEAFQFSHCVKTPQERVVYISESEILAVVKDKSTASGFSFSTRTCVVN